MPRPPQPYALTEGQAPPPSPQKSCPSCESGPKPAFSVRRRATQPIGGGSAHLLSPALSSIQNGGEGGARSGLKVQPVGRVCGFRGVARVQKRCRALLHRTPRRWRAVRGFPEPPPVAGDGEPAHQPSLTSTAAARRSAKRHRPIRRGRFLYRDGISRRADPPGNPEGCWRLARRTTPGQPFCVSPPRRWRGIPLVCH